MAINSLSASSHGLSGLVSGMDTQQMVESMLSGTQSKIDAANQKKAQLTYKQVMYRDVAAKIKSFQTSFFSYTSSSGVNLMSPSFFNSMSASSSSSAFKATASSNAATGKTVVNYVRQLAQNMKLKSTNPATGSVAGKLDATKLKDLAESLTDAKNNLKIQAGTNAAIEISLDKLAGKSAFEIERVLQDALVGSGVSVSYTNGQFAFKEQDGKPLTISGSKNAMALVGLGRETELYGKNGTITTKLDGTNLLPSIDVTLNGVKKSITFNPFLDTDNPNVNNLVTPDVLANRLNDAIHNAFGSGASVKLNANNEIEFYTKDTSSKLTVNRPGSQTDGLGLLGIPGGASTKISLTMNAKDANLQTKIVGDVQRFSINGVDFSFSSDKELSTIISEINSSNAGVKISYVDVEDRFVIEAKTSGELAGINPADQDNPFRMSQTEGNFLTALFGVQPGSAATGGALSLNKEVTGTKSFDKSDLIETSGKEFKLALNGVTFNMTVPTKDDGSTQYTMAELAEALNKKVEATMGKDIVKFSVSGPDGAQQLTMSSAKGYNVKVVSGLDDMVGLADDTMVGMVNAELDTGLSALGLDGISIKVGGANVDLTGVTDIRGLEKALSDTIQAQVGAVGNPNVGAKFDESTGRFRIFGVDIPMSFEIGGDDGRLFGASQFTLGSDGSNSPSTTMVQQGQNAIISINGVEIERSTNEFSVDGISYELKDVNYKAGADNAEAVIVSRDTDVIVDGLKKFVEEYNKLVNDINKLLDEDPSYRDYPPLTTKQKADMSDKEIEQWEEKAKEGLLRNDSVLEGVMQSLRGTLYTKPDGGRLALYDLGISTQYFGTKDNLTIDESALRKAVAENPDDVMKLFTDSTKGLAQLMNKAADAAVAGGSNPGSIVRQAGSTGTTDTSSSIYKQVKDINDRLKTLNKTYTSQYNRYWAQFNKMEQVIARMNQQSSWLGQQFTG